MSMDPRELTALITGTANALSCKLSTEELEILGVVFNQLGDTLITLATQKRLLDARCACCEEQKKRTGA